MTTISEVVYNDCVNEIGLTLSVDGEDITHSGIVRCIVKIGSTTIDSDQRPELFDLTQSNKLLLLFGDAGLIEGEYEAKLYVFGANDVKKRYWCTFNLTVSS